MNDVFTVTSSVSQTKPTASRLSLHFLHSSTPVPPHPLRSCTSPHLFLRAACSIPFLCQGKNVTRCKLYSLYNTPQDWISEADFVFELLGQLVEDRLTAHLLHNGDTSPVVQTPVTVLPHSICHSCVCVSVSLSVCVCVCVCLNSFLLVFFSAVCVGAG